MKIRFLILTLFTAGILGMAGCAGTPPQPEQSFHAGSSIDYRYIGEVERRARTSGVRIQWVNPPRTSTSNDADIQSDSERR